ncbi:MAG: hypothetical protein ACTSPG_03180 [Candidatus Hodarchaeales archaeon]
MDFKKHESSLQNENFYDNEKENFKNSSLDLFVCNYCRKTISNPKGYCPFCGKPIYEHDKPYQPKFYSQREQAITKDRPTGVTILVIFLCIGVLGNFSSGLNDLSDLPIIGLFALIFAFLQIIVIFGLWNMKSWAPSGIVALYSLNIVSSFLMIFIMPPIMVDMVLDELGSLARYASHSQIQSIVLGPLFFQFIAALVIGLIIISYIKSKKEYFVY